MLSVKTMAQRMAVQLWPFRTVSWLFSICGGLALILATVGLAGVVIHAVSRRLREFGVRVSIGATPRDLVGGRAEEQRAPPAARPRRSARSSRRRSRGCCRWCFIGVNVLNPLTYLAVALLECAIVCVACIGPALRASRVDPLVALRPSE